MRLSQDEPLARALVEAIQFGDIESLEGLLRNDPALASARMCQSGRPRGRDVACRDAIALVGEQR